MGAERPTPDGREVDDRLEPPTLHVRPLVWIAVGAPVFLLTAMALLALFYQLLLRNPARQPLHPFPEPRLETSIDPRSMPATPEPGPAPPVLAHAASEPAAADLDPAMRAIAAKGEHAFDPLAASSSGNTAQ